MANATNKGAGCISFDLSSLPAAVQKPFSKLQNFIQQAVAPNLTNKLTDDKPWINIKGNSVTFGGPGPTTDKEAGPNGYVEGLRLDKHSLVKDLLYGQFKGALPWMQMCKIHSTGPLKVSVLLPSGSWDTKGGSYYTATDLGTGSFAVNDVTPGQLCGTDYKLASIAAAQTWFMLKVVAVSPSLKVDIYTAGGWDTNGGSHYAATDLGDGCWHVNDVAPGELLAGTYYNASSVFRLRNA